MGTYNLNAEEIADVLEKADIDGNLMGDYSEATFLAGAKEYLKRLREMGARIPRK